jgi:hypothetical protein
MLSSEFLPVHHSSVMLTFNAIQDGATTFATCNIYETFIENFQHCVAAEGYNFKHLL